jgi:dCTP deaminase
MILSDMEIIDKVGRGEIGCDPHPNQEQIQPASLDVRMGEELYHCEEGKTETAGQHPLKPGKRYLGHTKETVELPDNIAAQLTGRSTIGRLGVIVHKTAGWIDPGFKGSVTLELLNMGESPVTLSVGDRVAQPVFFKLGTPSSGYDGKYQGQQGATRSR